jgi:hypothetical protein
MLTSLSILCLDQGPKWRPPEQTAAPEAAPERRRDHLLRALQATLADLIRLGRQPAAFR